MQDNLIQWLENPNVRGTLISIVGVIIIVILVRLLQRSFDRRIQQSDIRYRVRKLIGLLGYLTAFLYITLVFKDQLGHLTVALGVAGAGIAFALQEVIASIAGWVAISLGHFYQVGDRVLLGGIKGDVVDIGVLRTTLMEIGDWVGSDLYNGRIVRIANSFVFKEPVFNYSGDFPFLWDELTIPVKYGGDRKLAKEIILQVAKEIVGDYALQAYQSWQNMIKKYMLEHETVEPIVTLIANDNWMEYTLRYVVDYKRRRLAKDQLFTRILDEIDKTDGRVAIASTTIHLVETPAFDVRISEEMQKNS
jgi:small-conductance mechanosensitive channel